LTSPAQKTKGQGQHAQLEHETRGVFHRIILDGAIESIDCGAAGGKSIIDTCEEPHFGAVGFHG